MKKSVIGFFLLFILFTTYLPNIDFNKNFNLSIKNIKVEDNFIIEDKQIIQRLRFLLQENLFFLNYQEIKNSLKNETFIDSFSIKKIYPDTLILTIKEKIPIAILQKKREKFYISDKGDLLEFKDIKIYKDLPTVLGNRKEFYTLYKNLRRIEFPIEKIKSFYYFEAGRWDLVMTENKVIKLPIKNYMFSLKNYLISTNDNSFNNYKIYDYRVKDQLILN